MTLIVIGVWMLYITTVAVVYASVDGISVEEAFKMTLIVYVFLALASLSVFLIIKGVMSL